MYIRIILGISVSMIVPHAVFCQSFNLFDAVECGDTDGIRRVLRASPNLINESDNHEQTLLHKAALKGHDNMVKMLLNAGASVDVCDSNRNTPLLLAVWRGHHMAMMHLLSYGADQLRMNKGHMTCTKLAINNKDHVALYILNENSSMRATVTLIEYTQLESSDDDR